MDLTKEQHDIYSRYIKARNQVGLVPKAKPKKQPWVRMAEVIQTVDIVGFNHPFYQVNELWLEYLEASLAWWKIEPTFRDQERYRSSRGDYGPVSDNWDTSKAKK
jgi:hypothetical protein